MFPAAALHTELLAEAIQRLLAADVALAGRQGARQKPTIHQLDQDGLNRVFTKLDPEALAIAGLIAAVQRVTVCPIKTFGALRQSQRR